MRPVRLLALVLTALALWAAPAAAQDLPPGPTTVHPLARMPLEGGTGRFDEAQTLILEFSPGAWTPLHTHGGLTLVRVLEGEMTRRAGGTEDVFQAGEGWVEVPGDVHAAPGCAADHRRGDPFGRCATRRDHHVSVGPGPRQ